MADTAMLFTELERLYQRQVNSRAYELRLAELGESDPASDEWKSASMAATMAEVEFGSALLRNYSTISRVLREAADGWRPIETAPRDGTEIMLSGITPGTSNRWQGVGAWWHDDWRDDEENNMFGFHAPSHWRPLPPPPSPEPATHSLEGDR